jgi:PAS domain S-box-containing protein
LKKYFKYLIILTWFYSLSAQQNKKDSLLKIYKRTANYSSKIRILHQLTQASDSVHYAFEGLDIAEKINNKNGIALSLLDIGRWYYFAGKEDAALSYLIKSIKVAEEVGDKQVLKNSYRYIGFIYRPHEPFKAKEYYEKSLALCEETSDELAASYVLSAIGNIYEGIYDASKINNKKALLFYAKSLRIREKLGSPSEIASSLNETSRMYKELGGYTKAIELRERGLGIAEKTGDIENIVFMCNLLGNDYSERLKDYKTALTYQLKAYRLGTQINNNYGLLLDISSSIAKCYNALGDYKKANEYFLSGIKYDDSLKTKAKKYDYSLSSMKQDLEKELEQQKLLVKDAEILKEKVKSEKQTVLRNGFITGFIIVFILALFMLRAYSQKRKINIQLDIRNKEVENAYKNIAISEANFKQITETINDMFYLYNIELKRYEYVSPNCFDILGLTPEYFYEGKSTKAIIHEIDLSNVIEANTKINSGIAYDIEYRILVNGTIKWIEEKSSPIYNENNKLIKHSGICRDITKRKEDEELLSKKKKDITDSIIYAKTIQDAILVPKQKIAEYLTDFFILSKPKEIVSGDFYFFKETKNGLVFAAADCTGHGVPAGFMSMIGNAFLNEIVNASKVLTPAKTLEQLRLMIINALHQKTNDLESKDGMDIALLYFENNNRYVQYAGAFNSLFLVRDGMLKEYNADLFPIGIHISDNVEPFTNNMIELQPNDSLYIFSDGFSDQLGGPNGRKMAKKQIKELLISIQNKPMVDQEVILNKTFEDWKGNAEQIDDVLFIGIRV